MTKYIKKGGGTMRVNCAGRIVRIKSKEVFDNSIFEFIPESFRDLVEPYEGNGIPTTLNFEKQTTNLKRNKVETSGDKSSMQRTPKKEVSAVDSKPVEPISDENSTKVLNVEENAAEGGNIDIFIKIPGGGGWFNIINTTTGKKINENALREVDADGLLEQLKSAE